MNPALREFWITPSRFKVLPGGRASSKSWDAAANAIRIAQMVKVRVLCARMYQNKIEESVYTLLKIQIERFGLQGRFEIQKNKITCITTGSEFIFYGIARNIAEIKGLEGIDILWLEEAESVSSEQYGILEATVRSEGSEIWLIFNPRLRDDFIYQNFVENPPPGALVRHINFDENPFLSQTAINDALTLKARDFDEYEHRYLGKPRNDDDKSIIKRTWLESAIDAHTRLEVVPSGKRRVGFDIADDGADKNATVLAHGVLCERVDEWKGQEDELLQSCTRAYTLARDHGAEIDYDSIGVGASAGAKFKELNEAQKGSVVYRKFNAAGKIIRPDEFYMPGVRNKEKFENLKAQSWVSVADRLRITHAAVTKGEDFEPQDIISLSPDIDKLKELVTELSTPHRGYTNTGKDIVESKKDLAKRDVKSPNKADAFIMAYAPIDRGPAAPNIRRL